MNIILSNSELYEMVRNTITAVERAGMELEARRLEAAMRISSLPGEILGEIRLVLREVDVSRITRQQAYEVESEITYINSVLR